MFDGIGKLIVLIIITALLLGAVGGIVLLKFGTWILQHLDVTWK